LSLVNPKFIEIQNRHQKSNEALMIEINRLTDELENCKKCEEKQDFIKNSIQSIEFYKTQCDSLSAQLSRAQASLRKNKS
jgi:hypothetical protein